MENLRYILQIMIEQETNVHKKRISTAIDLMNATNAVNNFFIHPLDETAKEEALRACDKLPGLLKNYGDLSIRTGVVLKE